MFEVREGVSCVNGEVFQTFERDARDGDACFEVEAGTTGFWRISLIIRIVSFRSAGLTRIRRD